MSGNSLYISSIYSVCIPATVWAAAGSVSIGVLLWYVAINKPFSALDHHGLLLSVANLGEARREAAKEVCLLGRREKMPIMLQSHSDARWAVVALAQHLRTNSKGKDSPFPVLPYRKGERGCARVLKSRVLLHLQRMGVASSMETMWSSPTLPLLPMTSFLSACLSFCGLSPCSISLSQPVPQVPTIILLLGEADVR